MSIARKGSWVAVTFLIFVSGNNAIFGTETMMTQILQPIRSSGDEVGLIFISDQFVAGKKYTNTAKAIQEASNLRIWVALTGSYLEKQITSGQVKQRIESAIFKLKHAGMASDTFVGVGHGLGGEYLAEQVPNTALGAVVLLGSTLPRDVMLRDFPVPVLTLFAELDGLMRITRAAEEYRKLTDDVLWTFLPGVFKTPVLFIEGANHSQFASGAMPPHIAFGDLLATVTEDEAHAMIGRHINNFLIVSFGTNQTENDEAIRQLIAGFFQSVVKFQPFLDLKRLDSDGDESMWTVLAQEYFAGEYSDRVDIFNHVMEGSSFFTTRPSIKSVGKRVVVGTAAEVKAESGWDLFKDYLNIESLREISMKLISKDAIWKKLVGKNDTMLRSPPNTCKSLNELALTLALSLSSATAQHRYKTHGRPIIFEEDIMHGSNMWWGPASLKTWNDDSGLHVQSVAMVTSITSFLNPGVHYCKVMPLYRAMEWVNIDSLRPY